MRLIYTDIGQDLTDILSQEALALTAEGKRVFYIAPNSLSFEKERQVLERLPQKASFDIIVTRFAQMARYLTLNDVQERDSIDEIGLSMLFYRALNSLPEGELKVFGRLRQNMDFIQQLVDLHQELQEAKLTIADLGDLDSKEKAEDLERIFETFYSLLSQENFHSQTKIGRLIQEIEAGQVTDQLGNLALVIDGFTRFSAEEAALISSLHAKGVPITIGSYASPKAYQARYITGNLYQAGVDFLRDLAKLYDIKPEYLTAASAPTALTNITAKFTSLYDFSSDNTPLAEEDKKAITIWEVISQKEEVLHVAKQIRYYLTQGYRYKDILVLLGDVDSYRLQIGKVFDQYEIPYYFAKSESMAQHPLVALIDSLVRIKRYRFQTEDVLNLLKTGLYGQFKQEDLDKLTQYVTFAQIKGASKFSRDFTVNHGEKFDLNRLNDLRQTIIPPLLDLLQARKQTGQGLLNKLLAFLKEGQVTSNLASLAKQGKPQDQEETEQVWQLFTVILDQFNRIFSQETLSMEECLTLIRAGMMGANFRMVPATLDVVNVKSYDLITPQANKLVFAIGLTQGNFPKQVKNTSLISDQERSHINQNQGQDLLEINRMESNKRSHFAALSLINAASDQLILSSPQLFKENEEAMSPYLLKLLELGLPKLEKGTAKFETSIADIGNSKGLLSRVVELNRQELEQALEVQEATFWSVAVRYLRKKLAQEDLHIPQISLELNSQPLAKDTLAVLYPDGQALKLSASSLSDFYNSEYKYFLRHVLGLQETPSLLPDARIHGNFLHKVFEQVLQDNSARAFDQKVAQAIKQTSQIEAYRLSYSDNSENQFVHAILRDIARSTATALRNDQLVTTIKEEADFRQKLIMDDQRPLHILGKIDRIDQLKTNQALGVIDYKSSSQSFQISRFYNGLSPQLMTYLMALENQAEPDQAQAIFGAMYLHMTDPIVQLSKVKQLEQIPKESHSQLQFKGLFLEGESQGLGDQYAKSKQTSFNQEEFETLLAYTKQLYLKAGQRILEGHFAINPYSEDGRSVAGDQYNSITHFEADHHLGQARFLAKLGRNKEDWLDQMRQRRTR